MHQLRRIRALGRCVHQAKKLIEVRNGGSSHPPVPLVCAPLLYSTTHSLASQFKVNLKFAATNDSCMTMASSVMIDSGATANFVSVDFITSLLISALDSFSPQVVGADGKILSKEGRGYCYKLTIWLSDKH